MLPLGTHVGSNACVTMMLESARRRAAVLETVRRQLPIGSDFSFDTNALGNQRAGPGSRRITGTAKLRAWN
jgi:hypothetical protein